VKLILVVKTKNRPKTFANTTLKYISRSGFDYCIYVKRGQFEKYWEAMKTAAYKYYLDIPGDVVKKGKIQIPKKYDIALYLPDNLKGFTDDNLLQFCRTVGEMRSAFGKNVKLKQKSIDDLNMVRCNK
jgi:hypothetical protein